MKSVAKSKLFRELPSVDELLRMPEVTVLTEAHGTTAVADAARAVLARLRSEISSGFLDAAGIRLAIDGITDAVKTQLLRALSYSLRPVINATGVILHTNLGRAPLSESVLAHIRETAADYTNLEFELEAGERGKRDIHVDRLFRKLLDETAAQADVSTIVVNNNA